jgi:hypothetical protein
MTYEQEQHPIAVMEWGALGPGLRSHLPTSLDEPEFDRWPLKWKPVVEFPLKIP